MALYKAILNKDNKRVVLKVKSNLRLLGRYVLSKDYGPFLIKAISNDLAAYYGYTQMGALRAFGELFAGSVELLQKG